MTLAVPPLSNPLSRITSRLPHLPRSRLPHLWEGHLPSPPDKVFPPDKGGEGG